MVYDGSDRVGASVNWEGRNRRDGWSSQPVSRRQRFSWLSKESPAGVDSDLMVEYLKDTRK